MSMKEIGEQKILSLKVSNVKRIRVAHIKPDGKHVVLTGDNDQGKSSAMDSVMMAIDGGKSIPDKPLRHGAKRGETEVELTDFIVRRTYTAKGNTTLTVKSKADKKNVGRPQSTLDQLKSDLTFDPIAFSRMSAPDQAETARKLAGIDLTEIDNELKQIEEKRLHIGRQGRELGSELKVAKVYESVPEKEVTNQDLMNQLAAEEEKNRLRRQEYQRVESVRQEITEINGQITAFNDKITDLKAALKQTEQNLMDAETAKEEKTAAMTKAEENLAGLPEGAVDEIKAKIEQADEINRQVRHNQSIIAKRSEYEDLIEQYKYLDEGMKSGRNKRTDILAQSQLPIEGLEFNEEGVTLDGIPFDQLGTATRIKVSTQIGIAMNPKLRVMFVRDASLMDEKTLTELMRVANENGIQVWLEQVDENAPDGADIVVFEDGAVKFEGGEEAETVDPSPNAAPFNDEPAVTPEVETDNAVDTEADTEEATGEGIDHPEERETMDDSFFGDESPAGDDVTEGEDTEEF